MNRAAGGNFETNPSGGTRESDRPARTMLPIPDRPSFGLTTYDAKSGHCVPTIEPCSHLTVHQMVIILLDDVGFGASSTFGGPCRTPTADRLAEGGLHRTT